jgi:AAA+ superfamily predicted ATPase
MITQPEMLQPVATLLAALDRLLAVAIECHARRLGAPSPPDPWRGMHLDAADLQRLLGDAAPPAFDETGAAAMLAATARRWSALAQTARALQLSSLDLAVLVIVLAPDVDLRYERCYAYLQDDIGRKRPGIDLVANLLATSAEQRLLVLHRCSGEAPLCRQGLLVARGAEGTPELARALSVDALWRKHLLGQVDLVLPEGASLRWLATDAAGLDGVLIDTALRDELRHTLAAAHAAGRPARYLLCGPHGAGKLALARALAGQLGCRLLALDLRDSGSCAGLGRALRQAQRTALLSGALLYLHGVSDIARQQPPLLREMQDQLAAGGPGFVLSITEPLPAVHGSALPAHRVVLGLPAVHQRERAWHQALGARGLTAPAAAVASVAARFRMSAAQIAQAATDLALQPAGGGGAAAPDAAALARTARTLCGGELARMALRISPQAGFEALVVHPETEAQLREICVQLDGRDRLRRGWLAGWVHARADGITALFAGPSGTGKTLAAEVVAHAAGLDLFCIDLAGVVSKYIGETEKNLDRVFAAAENANAVLFFDEADALFGKRSEVKDAHDRYANIEIAYLLQRMERFDGLAILATNLRQNLDDAFLRRLRYCVSFPFPEFGERLRLWQSLWPAALPRAADIDLAALAQAHRFSGGSIRNVIVLAAHLAAADEGDGADGGVALHHLMRALRREYQKLGKALAPAAAAAAAAAAATTTTERREAA